MVGKKGDPGRSGEDDQRFIEDVLWLVRTGASWRDLPPSFGNWGSVWKRLRCYAEKGVSERIFNELPADPDFKYALFGSTIIKVYQHAVGVKGQFSIKPSVSRRAD